MLPTEAILIILKYALQSQYDIIDPLSPLLPRNLTSPEKCRGNQIAIHFLATSRAFHKEGTKLLWENNTFTFTSTECLRRFGDLESNFRDSVSHVTLRIVAHYYDDERRNHQLQIMGNGREYPLIPVSMRPGNPPFSRGGFRCYAWSKLYDFLKALSTRCRPQHRPSNHSRLQLLPGLTSLRLDLVNFDPNLPPVTTELHSIASHELACTLDELQVTGMPFLSHEPVARELTNLLKDRGLFLRNCVAFIFTKGQMQTVLQDAWDYRIVRCWEDGAETDDTDNSTDSAAPLLNTAPAVPLIYPEHADKSDDTRIWKKVPPLRDSACREWVPFLAATGLPDEEYGIDENECWCEFMSIPHFPHLGPHGEIISS